MSLLNYIYHSHCKRWPLKSRSLSLIFSHFSSCFYHFLVNKVSKDKITNLTIPCFDTSTSKTDSPSTLYSSRPTEFLNIHPLNKAIVHSGILYIFSSSTTVFSKGNVFNVYKRQSGQMLLSRSLYQIQS